MNLQKKAQSISKSTFLGGKPELFETAGRMQLIILLKEGIYPFSKTLDIGCGCLRGGYWMIHFLNPGCYFGLEPNQDMLNVGIREFLEPDILETKKPRFSHNSDFDFSVFDETFDFFIARSVWTHASKLQIEKMLDSFLLNSHRESVFLTSYLKASTLEKDYSGDTWVGQSHDSQVPGVVMHSFDWIQEICAYKGLVAKEITQKGYNIRKQIWISIEYANSSRQKSFFERFIR